MTVKKIEQLLSVMQKTPHQRPESTTPTDRTLIKRLTDSIVDMLDYSADEQGTDRSTEYGFIPFADRVNRNKHLEESVWALGQLARLNQDRTNAVNKSVLGCLLLEKATDFYHVRSYLALFGFTQEDAQEALITTVWSKSKDAFTSSANTSLLKYTAGLFAYSTLSSDSSSPNDRIMAEMLLLKLGKVEDGKPEHFAFNRGWCFAQATNEHRPQARARVSDREREPLKINFNLFKNNSTKSEAV